MEAWGGNRDQIIVAYLHDTVEDTSATLDIIEKKFGKEEYINKELVSISSEALLVKLADMYSNMLDFPTSSQSSRMYRNIVYLQSHRINLTVAQKDLINEIKIAYIFR